MPDEMDGHVDDADADDAQQDEHLVHQQRLGGGAGGRLPSIPIERLNDVVALEEFARR